MAKNLGKKNYGTTARSRTDRSQSIDMGRTRLKMSGGSNASESRRNKSYDASIPASQQLPVPFIGIVIESYSAQRPSEISVETGDEVRVTDVASSEHWWYGEVVSRSIQGWLPKSVVLCDGLATPRDLPTTTTSTSTATFTATSTATAVKSSAPLPISQLRRTRNGLSRPIQALVSPANALVAQRARQNGGGGAFFGSNYGAAGGSQGASQGERKMDPEPDDAARPLLRRFVSGRGTQWAEYADKNGDIYFHNTSKDEVKWKRPQSAQPIKRVRDVEGNAWSQYVESSSSSGGGGGGGGGVCGQKTYWMNEQNGEIARDAPQEERELRTVNSMGGTAWREHLDDSGSSYWYVSFLSLSIVCLFSTIFMLTLN